jgi:tripartite-type tricarboxylate transporter receptor subunit TctC
MKKLFFFLLALLLTIFANASPIKIYYEIGTGPAHGPTVWFLEQIKEFNKIQTKYEMIPEFKPGAGGVLAIKATKNHPEYSLFGSGPHLHKHFISGALNESDFKRLPTGYDMCTSLITNLNGIESQGLDMLEAYRGKELVVGSITPGSPGHLVVLEVAKRYGFKVRLATFPSEKEAFFNMVADNGVQLASVNPQHYLDYKEKNAKLKTLASNCPNRIASVPNVKTFAEYKIQVPQIFITSYARKEMPDEMVMEIGKYLNQAADSMQLWKKVPIFHPAGSNDWYRERAQNARKFLELSAIQ